MRNDLWLKNRLEYLWGNHFPDVERKNNIHIGFKGNWKNKFGHIKKKGIDSEIIVNGYFKKDVVPDYIIDLTIAHELVHYMHGFNSPYPRLFKHPHKGGIVNKELKKRGFKVHIKDERRWIKEVWRTIMKEEDRKSTRLNSSHMSISY